MRVSLLTDHDEDAERLTFNATVAAIRAFSADETDFTGRNPLAVRAKATGQLHGHMDAVNSVVSQLIPHWDGDRWVAGRATGNCGDVLLAYLRGWYIDNRLVAGMGLPDARIDFDSIQGFVEHCARWDLEINLILDDGRDHLSMLKLICQCGWGSIDRQTGKWGVIWEDAATPMTALVTPASVVAGSMSVTYNHEGLADEVTGTFIDETSDYEVVPIRRLVPGTIVAKRPVTISLEGIVKGRHAAMEVNRTVAAQHYHARTIAWEMDIDEAITIARGDVVGMAHGIMGAGAGGRLLRISSDRRTLTPARTVREPGTVWVWDLNNNVFARAFTLDDDGAMRLDAALPAPPPHVPDNPHAYRFMAFRRSADVIKVRITAKEPASGTRIRFRARDEVQEYYDHRTSDLTWTPASIGRRGLLDPVRAFRVSFDATGTRLFSWAEHPHEDIVGYQIRFGPLDTRFGDMTPLHTGNLIASPWTSGDRPPAGAWSFGIVGVTRRGRLTGPTYTTRTLPDPPVIGRELVIYRAIGLSDALPTAPPDATWDHSADTLTDIPGWSRQFPAYNPETQKVACTLATGFSNDSITAWSTVRVCESAGDLNAVYTRRAPGQTPGRPPSGPRAVPTGWVDLSGNLVGSGLAWVSVGHRPVGSADWNWGPPSRIEALDGDDGEPGISAREITVYRVGTLASSAPSAPSGARWNHYFDSLRSLGRWSRSFPYYNPDSQKVWCTLATGFSNNTLSSWSTVRVCESAGDLNAVYRRVAAGVTPSRPATGTRPVPINWVDLADSLTGDGLAWVSIGHRPAHSATWTWSAPMRIDGLDGRDGVRGPALWRIEIRASEIPALRHRVTLPAAYVTRANNATEGDNVVGDFVVFFVNATGRGAFSSAWSWNGAEWKPAPPFLAALTVAAVNISAIFGTFGDLTVTGTLAADKIDSNVRNYKHLWSGSTVFARGATHDIDLTTGRLDDVDILGVSGILTISGLEASWSVLCRRSWVGGTERRVGTSVSAGDGSDVSFGIRRMSATRLRFRELNIAGTNQNATIHEIYGWKNPT